MSAPKRRTIHERWTANEMYPTRRGQSAEAIEATVTRLYPTQPFATHGSVCADLLLDQLVKAGYNHAPLPTNQALLRVRRDRFINTVLVEQSRMVGRILVYSRNVPTGRAPKSLSEQMDAFKRNLYASWRIALTGLERLKAEPSQASQPVSNEPEQVVEAEQVEVVEPTCPLRAHHQWSVSVARTFEARGKSWSYRGTVDGIALIAAGCAPLAVRDSCLMDYPDDLRAELGVEKPFDFSSIDIVDYLTKAASARVDQRGVKRPVCIALIGPAGTGKTTLSEVLAERIGADYYDLSMSAGTPLSAFYGREGLAGDVRISQFERWAINGGLHLFDEMDCSEPNLLKIVNKALANRCYTNPLTGESIKLSENAVALAAMNTLGVGVQTEYSAAEQLDFSTIDRFRAGRVRIVRDYDREAQIVDAQIAALKS